ncbi:MAG: aminopeptidase [Chloroflexi bacterium]|nr:aminopeptidase [Chloroflexota bacterium]
MTWYKNVVDVCMGVKATDRVLLITDEVLSEEQELLAQAIQAHGPLALKRWTLPEDQRPLKVAPDEIIQAIKQSSVGIHFLGQTTHAEQPYRISVLQAVEKSRIRLAAGINMDQAMFTNELTADYVTISANTYRLLEHLQHRDQVHITSPLGTDLRMSISGRRIAVDPGIFRSPGYYNLPSGECYVAPIEDSAEGTLVIDKSFPGILIEEPISLIFKKGRIVEISGGTEAAQLRQVIETSETQPNGEGTRNIAELGIGTNPQARITGNSMTDEKVMGTIHIAIGHNANAPYNGKNVAPIHLDGVMGEPTLRIDEDVLIKDGEYLL